VSSPPKAVAAVTAVEILFAFAASYWPNAAVAAVFAFVETEGCLDLIAYCMSEREGVDALTQRGN